MKYQDVSKKKNRGKVAIIITVLVMVVALATAGIGAYYFYFSNRAKYVFDDLKNLDVESIEELNGVYFPSEDFSYTGFLEEMPDNGKYFDGTLDLSVINLHSNDSEKTFEEPEIGDKYNIQIEANGNEYAIEQMEIVDYHGKGTVEGAACFNEGLKTEVVVYLLPYFYIEEVSPFLEVMWSPDAIGSLIVDERPEGSVVGGYCFVITSFEPIEEIKFLSIEKVN